MSRRFIGVVVASFLSVTGLERSVVVPAVERKLNMVRLQPQMESALMLMEQRNYRAAVAHLKAAVRTNPEESDLCQLLAQCYVFMGQPVHARHWLRQELLIHLKQRNSPMIVEAYFELLRSSRELAIGPKESHLVASALRREGYEREADRVET